MNLMVFNFLSIVHYSITLPHRRVVLLCAGILGRYYTDHHDVDEDLRIIPSQGGRWNNESSAGITERSMNAPTAYVGDVVASKNRAFMILLVLMLYYKKYINYSILRIVITIIELRK